MSKVEEITSIRATPGQAMRALANPARFAEWVAPDVTLTPHTRAASLAPGDRLHLEILGGAKFDYTVEAATDREIVFSFFGPWSGEERWSFIADGAETLVRRVYDVRDAGGLAGLAWPTVGRALVMAHFKLELMRFREMVERNPGPAGEIAGCVAPSEVRTSYEVDEG
jgi:uncharacterized protein YndB with AHSA1/START domain